MLSFTALLHSTTLHCAALAALYYAASRFIVLHCATLCYIVLHSAALRCIALHFAALHFIVLHCAVLRCIALHFVALRCIALHCAALRCIALHCAALHCTGFLSAVLFLLLHRLICSSFRPPFPQRNLSFFLICFAIILMTAERQLLFSLQAGWRAKSRAPNAARAWARGTGRAPSAHAAPGSRQASNSSRARWTGRKEMMD
jgi:hypothetical protein